MASLLRYLAVVFLVAVCAFAVAPSSRQPVEAGHMFLRFPWTYGSPGEIINGYNSPPTHVNGNRWALDFQIEGGSTQAAVRAAASGSVVFVDSGPSVCDPALLNGKYVDVQSTDWMGTVRYARYAHLSSPGVSQGQTVYQGEQIGTQGNSGWVEPCSAVHLHFRWAETQNCYSGSTDECEELPQPMSGEGEVGEVDFAAGQTWVSDNSDRPPIIEGMLIKGSGPNIYVVDNGKKRLITSPAVYTSCGYNPNPIDEVENVKVSDTALNLMFNGPNVTGGPCPYTLVQAPGSPHIYVVEKGYKRHIASPDVLIACYNGANIVVGPLPSGTGDVVTGPPCPYARRLWHSDALMEGTLVKGSGPNIYLVVLSGKRHITSPDAFVACGYRGNDVVPITDTALNLMTTVTPLSGQPCPHSLFQPPGSPDIYVITSIPTKRHITSPDTFLACGYNGDQVVQVNPPLGSSPALARPPCLYTRD